MSMELKLENWPAVTVRRFGQVAEALVRLTDKEGDHYLILESPGEGFVQVRRRRQGFIVEWRQDFRSGCPRQALARASRKGSFGKIVNQCKLRCFKTYANEELRLGEAFEILCAFYYGPVRPTKFRWRGLSGALKRYSKLKATGKVE